MRLSHFLQSSLPTQILSTLINSICLNSPKMFMIVILPSFMGSYQKVMKSMTIFNIRVVQVLRHNDKSWLKTLIFSNNQYLSKCFSRTLFGFFNISCDFSELYADKNKEHKYHWWIQGPCWHQRWSFLSW